MTYLVVTDAGLQGTKRAEEGGFKLNITEFAVSEEQNVSLTVGDTALQGVSVYRGGIESIESTGVSTIKFTLTIPAATPSTGSWMVREIGLFLDTGELFAHGVLPTAMQKTHEFGIKFYVYVTVGRLGEIVNVTYTTTASVAATPHVSSLLHPNDSRQNVVAVLDQAVGEDTTSNASLAVKYGSGSSQWSFIGYKHQVSCLPSTIFSQGSFVYEVESKGGFWLNDDEVVIVQVLQGAGQGESRKMAFSKASNTFTTVDKNFSSLASTSRLAIWRDTSSVLPARDITIPEYFVLGAGKNSWIPNVTTLTSGTLFPYRSTHLVTGNSVNTGTDIPLEAFGDTTKFLVFVDGIQLASNQFTAAGGSVVTTVAAVTSIDVLAFEFIQDAGSSLYFFEAVYTGDSQTTQFQLPIIPDNANNILVYDQKKLVPPTSYVLLGSMIVFDYAPTGRIDLVPFTTYEELGVRSSMVKNSFTSTGTEVEFVCSSTFALRKDTLVTINGMYVEKDSYTVNANRLILASNLAITSGSIVDVINFAGTTTSVDSQPSGIDSGPVWMDPSGAVGKPNKLTPQVFTYHGDGQQTTFDIASVPDENYLFVFVQGVYQPPTSFYFSLLAIRFEQPIPAGYSIDIICWKSEPHTGTQVACRTTSLVMTANLSYTVHAILNVDSCIVSINGIYQHRESYTFSDPSTLVFSEATAGYVLEVWSFEWTAKAGYMTSIHVDQQLLTTNKDYLMDDPVVATADSLVFVGGAQLHKANHYNVNVIDGISTVQLVNNPYNYQQNLPLFIVELFSGKPQSRLMSRTEVESLYMPLRGPHVSWDNLTPHLKSILACPMIKLLGLMTGQIKSALNSPALTSSDKSVVNKWGLVPVKMTVDEDIIPVLNYAAIGSSVMLNIPVQFNFFDLLAKYIRTQLGVTDFSIRGVEQGVKYIIDDIAVANVAFDAKTRANMPGAPLDTAWVFGVFGGVHMLNTTHLQRGGTFGPLVFLTTDGEWWINQVGSASGVIGNPGITTVSVASVDDATFRHFTHVVRYNNVNYTIKIDRRLVITNHNIQFLTMISTGGAPVVAQLFARVYASLKYNDHDINNVIYEMNLPGTYWGTGGACSAAAAYVDFSYKCRSGYVATRLGTTGQYPAVAGYTAGLAYGVQVYDTNLATGAAKVVVYLTSGTIGYSQFGVDLMLNSVKLPTSYTVYPGIHVNPDGSVDPVLSTGDLFDSCCWTGVQFSATPDCTSETPALPTVLNPVVAQAQMSPSSLTTTDHYYVTVSNVAAGASISWESSDHLGSITIVGVADQTGYFSYTGIPAGAPRPLAFKIYVNGVYLATVGSTVTAAGGVASHGTVEFVTNGSFTTPDNIYLLQVEELGAGGAGAGGDHVYGGQGGSRGQYAFSTIAVVPGEVLDIIIGVGGTPGLGCITNPTSANNGTSGTNTILKRQNGTVALVAAGGIGGIASTHFGSGTNGQSSEMGLNGFGGAAGVPTYYVAPVLPDPITPPDPNAPIVPDPLVGTIVSYVSPVPGGNAGGYGAGGGGGGASARDIADAIPGAPGGQGTKGWLRLSY